jgi:hypothetical protein
MPISNGKKSPQARSVTCQNQTFVIHLVDGRILMVPWDWYPRLLHGTPRERKNVELLEGGTYLHWPDLDEDLTIAGVLDGKRSQESAASVRKWLAERQRHLMANKNRPKKRVRQAS